VVTTPTDEGGAAPDLLVLLHERADVVPPVQLTLADRLRVPFSGLRGGDGPLTISQSIGLCWVTSPAMPARMMEWPLSLPEGTTLADIAAALQVLVTRHESLRTCYPSAPPPGTVRLALAGALPEFSVQRVIRSGDLVIDVYTASEQPADDAVLVTELAGVLRAREFDLATELPVRMAVAMWQGTPRAAVILYSHMAVDMAAMVLLDRQFATLVTDPSSREVGPPGHHPLDQAEEERSARGLRRVAAAVRGWETALRTVPQCLYAIPSADPRHDGGVVSGWLWSRAGALALPHIAARTGASRQLVMYAALCTMIGWRTGHDTCGMLILARNRYRRELREYIGPLAQEGITCINVRARTLDEVVRRAAAAVLVGNNNSLIEITTFERIAGQVEQHRGITWSRYCSFNDISDFQGTSECDEPVADPAAAGSALAQTRFTRLPVPGAEEVLLRLLLQQVDGELIIGATSRDANRVPLSEIETLLRGTESLLVAAASGDVELSRLGEITGTQPIARGPGWVRIGPSWIELAEVQRLVDDALPGHAAVFAVPQVPGQPAQYSLVAYLPAGGGIDSAEQAHAACLATLAGTRSLAPPDGIRYTAMTPGRYVICAAAPGDVRDLAGWQRQTVLAQGDGRQK
jgi:hypothetical protein